MLATQQRGTVVGQNRAYEDRDAPARHVGGRDAERLRADVDQSANLAAASPAAPLLLSLQQSVGNRAVARLIQAAPAGQRRGAHAALRSLQRYKVHPQPRVEHQWLRKRRLVDLNCGWYAQLGVVDYHYLKSIAPRLTARQRMALEQGGHLSYAAGKSKLAHHERLGFHPEGRDVAGWPLQGTPAAAISTKLDKPTTPDEWEKALKTFGPLIVSNALHSVLVVGVTPLAFYYRDSLTGAALSTDFLVMNRIIRSVYCVRPREVERLFKRELEAAEQAKRAARKRAERLGRGKRFAEIGEGRQRDADGGPL